MSLKWTPLEAEPLAAVKASEAKADDKSIGARSSHGCTVIGDTLFMYGGEVIARTPVDSTIWSRNLGEGSEWTAVECKSATSPPPRVAHTQASVGAELYIFGGRQSIAMEEAPLNDLWKFSFKDKTWVHVTPGGTVPEPRSFHKMVSVGAKLYVFGGCSAKGRLADLHCYDTVTNTWSFVSNPPKEMAGRGGAGFVSSRDGEALFVVGGFIGKESNAVYRFDLEANTWEVMLQEGNDKVRPFSVSCGVSLPGKLVFFGGEVDPSEKGHEGAGAFCNDVLILDDKSGLPISVTTGSSNPTPRGWSDSDAWGDNKMVLYGGLSGDDKDPVRLADTWVLELTK